MKPWESIYSGLFDALTVAVNTISSKMSSELAAPLTAAMTLYIILYGIAIMKGAIQEPILDFAIRGIKLAIIWSLVTSAGDYTTWVGNTISNDLPQLIDTITGGAGTGTVPSDSVFSKTAQVADNVREHYAQKWGPTGKLTGVILYALVMFIGGIVLTGVSCFMIIWATFGLMLMAAIGPLYICFAMFDFSRGWFFSWLNQILNYLIFKLLVTVVSIVIILMMENALTQSSVLTTTLAVFYFSGVALMGIFVYLLIPSMSASLSGGAQASTGMLQRAAERHTGKKFGGNDDDKGGGARKR